MKAAAAWAAAAVALGVSAAEAQVPSDKTSVQRVCVYYDAGPQPSYKNGRLHAIMLENLLGHFRGIRVSLAVVSGYHAGGLSACDRAAYIGSYFGSRLPAAFLHDVADDVKPFLWASYNIRQLQNAMGVRAFAAKTGFVYDREAAIGKSLSGAGPADFYSAFYYKGRSFKKLAFKTPGGGFIASPDICLVRNASAVVLSTASDPVNGKETPYITRKRDFFYVADNPFLFIHERDRYLILADVLFDFVGRSPAGTRRWALIRLEDIHPNYNLELFYQSVEILKKRRVPFAVSLIPDYVAPHSPESAGVELGRRPAFLEAIRYAQANGGVILIHGYTHDVSGLAGCPSLGSGYDYEFWDRCRERPLPEDSAAFARGRIHRAKALLAAAGLSAVGWVTPHYAASPADFRVFAAEFDRTVQRVTYSFGWAKGEKPDFVNQFFPYTIYRDHYGQFVWPENLGFIPMPGSQWGYTTPPDIIGSARLSRVVRDGWASFYWHPYLLGIPGEKERLERTIDAIRADGYEFISLKELRARGE